MWQTDQSGQVVFVSTSRALHRCIKAGGDASVIISYNSLFNLKNCIMY